MNTLGCSALTGGRAAPRAVARTSFLSETMRSVLLTAVALLLLSAGARTAAPPSRLAELDIPAMRFDLRDYEATRLPRSTRRRSRRPSRRLPRPAVGSCTSRRADGRPPASR
jgi:hypothetical protein